MSHKFEWRHRKGAMAKGGARSGSGPLKGTKYVKAKPLSATPSDIKAAARKSKVTPLEYMLAVLNDEKEDPQMRARMAMAAAPYVHARAVDAAGGKKEQQQAEAERLAGASPFATPEAPKG